jgi:NAD(P)H dehydrogenase (quinone)
MYLVSGASGHLGRLTISHLIDTAKIPPSQIIATTRKPDTLADLAKRGVAVRAADFDSPASLTTAFAGAKRALLISTDAIGRRAEQSATAIAAAKAAGVNHLLYTSMPAPETSAVLFAPEHLAAERAIAACDIAGWTILRNNWYFENLFFVMPQALASGSWYSAAGNGGIAYIARDDLARAAALALATAKGRSTFTLTGARSYTTAEIASLVAAATSKPLGVVPVPVDGLIQGMIGAGLPEPVARVFASFDTATAKGDLAQVTGDYKTLTGLDPAPLEPWIAANAKGLLGQS